MALSQAVPNVMVIAAFYAATVQLTANLCVLHKFCAARREHHCGPRSLTKKSGEYCLTQMKFSPKGRPWQGKIGQTNLIKSCQKGSNRATAN